MMFNAWRGQWRGSMVAAGVADSSGAGREPCPHTPSPKVLLVEDGAANRNVAARMLEAAGVSVETASNGLEAVAMHSASPYEVLLMDCDMPVMSGYRAAEEVRRREDGVRHTPIVAMAVELTESVRERCQACGIDDYLLKPLMAEELAGAVRKWAPVAQTSPRQARPATPARPAPQ